MADDGLVKFLLLQYEQRVKQEQGSTKLYFQAIAVLVIVLVATITVIGKIDNWNNQVINVGLVGIPLFMISWFGCFLFIYWEHHMARVSLDYSEKLASELLGIPLQEVYLYHEDFLGVFNQADFPPRKIRWPELIRFKSVQWVFVLIGLPGVLVYVLCGFFAFKLITELVGLLWAYVYIGGLSIILLILLLIHIHCVRRERMLKKHLGVHTKWIGDIPELINDPSNFPIGLQ